MTCPTCAKCASLTKFIKAMIEEFAKYNDNRTAQYYKGQCEKVLQQTGGEDEIRS